MVDFYEMFVFGQRFFLLIIFVDFVGSIVRKFLAVGNGVQWQSVGWRRILVGPSERDGGYGKNKLGNVENIDNCLGLIHRGTEEAGAQSLLFGEIAESLGIE